MKVGKVIELRIRSSLLGYGPEPEEGTPVSQVLSIRSNGSVRYTERVATYRSGRYDEKEHIRKQDIGVDPAAAILGPAVLIPAGPKQQLLESATDIGTWSSRITFEDGSRVEYSASMGIAERLKPIEKLIRSLIPIDGLELFGLAPENTEGEKVPATGQHWILTWNPNKLIWTDEQYDEALETVARHEKTGWIWSCHSKRPQPGDLFYMMALGQGIKRGIVASGIVTAPTCLIESDDGTTMNGVPIDIEYLIDRRIEDPLPIEVLQAACPEQKWNPYCSGVSIKPQYHDTVDAMWAEYVHAKTGEVPIAQLEIAAKAHGTKKPKKKMVESTVYERDPIVAEYTKQRAKGKCQLCHEAAPFTDGDGKPYLECHHVIWLSRGGADDIGNTVALCPNCHRRMHIVDAPADVVTLMKLNE